MQKRFVSGAIGRRRKDRRVARIFFTIVVLSAIALLALVVLFVSPRPASARAFSFVKYGFFAIPINKCILCRLCTNRC